MMKLPTSLYQKIYDILEEYTGALPWHRDDFIEYFTTNPDATEYRCCDNLGFGGKFWNNAGKLYVSCYPEDETDERYQTIEKVNELLQTLLEEYLRSFPRQGT
jgi:hypothetical protein